MLNEYAILDAICIHMCVMLRYAMYVTSHHVTSPITIHKLVHWIGIDRAGEQALASHRTHTQNRDKFWYNWIVIVHFYESNSYHQSLLLHFINSVCVYAHSLSPIYLNLFMYFPSGPSSPHTNGVNLAQNASSFIHIDYGALSMVEINSSSFNSRWDENLCPQEN